MHKFALAPRYVLCAAFAKSIDRGCVDTATILRAVLPGIAPAYVMYRLRIACINVPMASAVGIWPYVSHPGSQLHSFL